MEDVVDLGVNPVMARVLDPQLAELANAIPHDNLHDQLNEVFLALCEDDVRPWVNPDGMMPMPRNVITGHYYTGINVIICWMQAIRYGFASQGWVTKEWLFKRAPRECRLKVKPGHEGSGKTGQRATTIVFAKQVERRSTKEAGDGESQTERYSVMKAFKVFNLDQLENVPEELLQGTVPTLRAPATPHEAHKIVNDLIAALGVNVEYGGTRAAYVPSRDLVLMPVFGSYVADSPEVGAMLWEGTRLHEITHWTKPRVPRETRGKGPDAYAFEELVAELGSAFLSADFGMPQIVRHPSGPASYIDGWRKILIHDRTALLSAAKQAMQARDWIHERFNREKAA